MRSSWLLLVALTACARAETVAPITGPAPPPLPPDEPAPAAIPLGALGADAENAEWGELVMPDDARVLTFAHHITEGEETWTLTEAGFRRVLRVRVADGKKIAQAAWVGTTTKEGMELRLVERKGSVRLDAERLVGTCARVVICEDGKPKHRVATEMCTFAGESGGSTDVYLAPGKGVDFAIASCPYVEPRHERVWKPARRSVMPRMP